MTQPLTTVFGGTGFLGQGIVRRLLAENHRVRIAVRHPRAGELGDRTEQLPADIRNADSVAAAVAGASSVVNTVGLYTERGRETFDAVHIQGAGNVAVAAARAGARLVHISGIGADQRSPSKYVRARASGEQAVRQSAGQWTILRPSVLFGPDDALLSTLERITRLLPLVPLFGTGDTRLQPVYSGDVAEAVLRVLARAEVDGEIYELGGPREYRYRDLIVAVLTHLHRKRLLLPVPFVIWELQSACLSVLPNPPLTRDQVILMRDHNVVGATALTFADLGMRPHSLADLLPECLPV
jgi:NADH dehydrogenase